jgi:3D (Asp-Asp-Asp) domain-containing protein
MNRKGNLRLLAAFMLALIAAGAESHFGNSSQTRPPALTEQRSSTQIHLLLELTKLRQDYQRALGLLEESFGSPVRLDKVRTVPITITAYSSTQDQCDSTPHITASNKAVRRGIVAISDDLMQEMGICFGQRVLIPGHGVFEVQDRMNPRWRRRVDIWQGDREAAKLFGLQKGTLLWIADSKQGLAGRAKG